MGLDSRHTGHGWELVARTDADTELRSEVAQARPRWAAFYFALHYVALVSGPGHRHCMIGQRSSGRVTVVSGSFWSLSAAQRSLGYICFVEKSEKKFSMHRASVVEMLNVDRGEAFKELPGQWIDIKYTSLPYKVRLSGGAGL